MAHADYNCCAVCDRKLAYAGPSAAAKKHICPSCLARLNREYGIDVYNVTELIAWMKKESSRSIAGAAGVLLKLHFTGYSKCHYSNEVDKTYAEIESRVEAFDIRNYE